MHTLRHEKHSIIQKLATKTFIAFSLLAPSVLNAQTDVLFNGSGYYTPSHDFRERSTISPNVVIQESWLQGSGRIPSNNDTLRHYKPRQIQWPKSENSAGQPQHHITEYYTHSENINDYEQDANSHRAVQLEPEQSFIEEQNNHVNRFDKKKGKAWHEQSKRQAELERERLKREFELARENRKFQQEMQREREKHLREMEKDRRKFERELAKSN